MAQCECTPWNSRRCEDPALAGQSRCILHDANSVKDAAEFLKMLKAKVGREEQDDAAAEVNLGDVVFPPGFCWRDVRRAGDAFPKRVSFVRAVFTGTADFEGAQFAERCDFGHATFTGNGKFQDARFTGDAFFASATFTASADFWRVIFSKAAHFGDVKFGGNANFLGATFSGDATFMGATFSGVASFGGVTFKRVASFWSSTFEAGAEFGSDANDTTFGGVAQFNGAKFRGVARFTDAKFMGAADFTRASFSGEVWFLRAMFAEAAGFVGAAFFGAAQGKTASFAKATFHAELRFRNEPELGRLYFPTQETSGAVDFTDVTLEKPERVYFQDVDLSRVSFRGTDLRQVRFLNATWAKLPKRPRPLPQWWLFTLIGPLWRGWPMWLRTRSLNVVYDDPDVRGVKRPKKGDYDHAAEVYRQLRVNLEENRQQIEAADFYIGQMDMRLHDSRLGVWHRRLMWLYGAAALYGERYFGLLILYFALGLLFAVGYLWGGFQGIEKEVHRNVWVGPSALWDWSFWKDYIQAFLVALTPGAPFRTEPQFFSWWLRPVQYVNTLLNVVLLTLVVIALRRAFRR